MREEFFFTKYSNVYNLYETDIDINTKIHGN